MVRNLGSWPEQNLERPRKPSYEELFGMVSEILRELEVESSPHVKASILALRLKTELTSCGFVVPSVMHPVILGTIQNDTLDADSIVEALQREFPDYF